MKCPKSSTKQILNANGITLTLRAWQRSNRIVYRHKDRLFKSNQLKLLEIIWNATILHRNDTLSPCLDVAAACIRVSNHIWSFYDVAWNVDVPTLWQFQKFSNDHSDRFREIPQRRLFTSTATSFDLRRKITPALIIWHPALEKMVYSSQDVRARKTGITVDGWVDGWMDEWIYGWMVR